MIINDTLIINKVVKNIYKKVEVSCWVLSLNPKVKFDFDNNNAENTC